MLVVLADSASISEAARRLGVAQPGVSTQLRRIENAVGQPLFERHTHGVVPTAAGAALVRQARLLLRDIALIGQAGTTPSGDPPIRVALAGVAAADLVPELAARSSGRVWDVRVRDAAEGVAAVRDGGVDALLVAHHSHAALLSSDDLVVREGTATAFQVLVPHDHKHVDEPIDLGELADQRWVVPADEGMRAFVVSECRAAGFEPDVGFVVDDPSAMLQLVAAGRAVTLAAPRVNLPRSVAGLGYQDATIVRWAAVYRPDLDPDVTDELVEVLTLLLDASPSTAAAEEVTGPAADTRPRTVRLGSMHRRPDAELPTVLLEDYAMSAVHRTSDAPALLAGLDRAELDVVVRHDYPCSPDRPPGSGPRAELEVVEAEPLMLAMTVVHPLASRPELSLADLAGQLLLGRSDRRAGELEPQLRLLASAGVTPARIVDWGQDDELHGLLWTTRGVALVGSSVNEPSVRLVPIAEERARRRVVVVWRPGGPEDAVAPVVARAHAALLRERAHPAVRDRLRFPLPLNGGSAWPPPCTPSS